LFAVLYYIGVMQWVVRLFAVVMAWFMGTSGAESLNVAAAGAILLAEAVRQRSAGKSTPRVL